MIEFDEDQLLAEACRKTGLRDFGDPRFREPLRRLLHSLEHDAHLSESGLATLRARILGNLTTRLAAEAFLERHPEILDEPIEEPVVIVGATRSGTTRLHRLLSEDPRHLAVLWWENRCPVPLSGSDWRGNDPRIREAEEEVRQVLAAAPEMAAIHPWDPHGPDEEALLCEHAFLSHVPESTVHVPGYRDWLEHQDQTPGYEFLAKMLRILQWQKKERGESGERWILKSPQHLGFLDAFTDVFPDARIIQTHRDPLSSLPSAASMFWSLWKITSDAADPHVVGRQVRNRLALDLERCRTFRERNPKIRVHDVWFEDMQRDPIAGVEAIYAWLGERLTAPTRVALEAWLVENAREKRPAHRYALEDFGLDADDIERCFDRYRRSFILTRPD